MECEIGKYAIGYKNITVNDQFFPGHFPERAIMPGGGFSTDPWPLSHNNRLYTSVSYRNMTLDD